jgi:hypothetical protein
LVALYNLAVNIVRFTDDHFPGWVASEFMDAEGHRHTIIDKVPGLSLEDLDATSKYPRPGAARCEVLDRWQDSQGRELARISLVRPDGLESTEGLSEFVVISAQLSASLEEST